MTEFSALTFGVQQFRDSPNRFRDRLSLSGAFTLGGRGADGIDPLAEEVKVTLRGAGGCLAFSQTIPPGAFETIGADFTFRGSGRGKLSLVRITPQTGESFNLTIQGTVGSSSLARSLRPSPSSSATTAGRLILTPTPKSP